MNFFKKIIIAFYYKFSFAQIENRIRYEIAIRNKKLKVTYQPVWLHLYVTSRCTFRCRFCTNHAVNETGKVAIGFHKPLKDMTFDTFKEILSKFNKAMVVTFCGVGEPFLNFDLLNMIKLAKKNHLVTEVVTNGSLLSNKTINDIFESGLDRLSISLNESDAERHNYIINTAKNFFSAIIENVKKLTDLKKESEKKIEIKISRVLTKNSLPLTEEFIDLGIKLGVDKVVFHNLIFSKITEFQTKECLFDESENRKIIKKIENKYKNIIKIEFPTLLKKDARDIRPRCQWYWKNMSIDAEGNVSGCGRFITPKNEFGNFRDKEVFNNRHFTQLRESFNNNHILDCCKHCVESSK